MIRKRKGKRRNKAQGVKCIEIPRVKLTLTISFRLTFQLYPKSAPRTRNNCGSRWRKGLSANGRFRSIHGTSRKNLVDNPDNSVHEPEGSARSILLLHGQRAKAIGEERPMFPMFLPRKWDTRRNNTDKYAARR